MDKKTESQIRVIQEMVSRGMRELEDAIVHGAALYIDSEDGKIDLTASESRQMKALVALVGRIQRAAGKADGRYPPEPKGKKSLFAGVIVRPPYKHTLFFTETK